MADFDPSKPVQTRAGRAAFVLKMDMKGGDAPIVGYVIADNGEECLKRWHHSGRTHPFFEDGSDLVNIPESKWMNVYDTPTPNMFTPCAIWHSSREDADDAAVRSPSWHRLAVVERTDFGNMFITKVEK